MNRWWVYQRERFPIFQHGPLIAAFSISAICFSSLLRNNINVSHPSKFLVGFITAFIFFLQLRLADEFKDFEEDSKFRPYRPVPRGLVKLKELAVIGCMGAVIQLGLALWYYPPLFFILLLAWTYLVLMTKEFFIRNWIKKQPLIYMLSHMAIVPIVDFYTTSCDWRPVESHPPQGLPWFIAASYFNGLVVELGRKIRSEDQEEKGVETYTFLWGRSRAISAWISAMILTAFCGTMAARELHFALPVLFILSLVFLAAFISSIRFLLNPSAQNANKIQPLTGIWTLVFYLSIGAIPFIWRHMG